MADRKMADRKIRQSRFRPLSVSHFSFCHFSVCHFSVGLFSFTHFSVSHFSVWTIDALSRYLASLVFRIEFEGARSDFSETFAAAQTDGERDQLVLAAKFKTAFGHTAID